MTVSYSIQDFETLVQTILARFRSEGYESVRRVMTEALTFLQCWPCPWKILGCIQPLTSMGKASEWPSKHEMPGWLGAVELLCVSRAGFEVSVRVLGFESVVQTYALAMSRSVGVCSM